MIDTFLSYVAPHHCYGCDKTGTLLCNNCKYDIISEPFLACVGCARNAAGASGLCGRCRAPYTKAWCAAWREDTIEALLNAYKFSRARAVDAVAADIVHQTVPVLPLETVIVPIPTIAPHIRQRGYDHMERIARHLGHARGLAVRRHLRRQTTAVQHGSTAQQRRKQATEAFLCNDTLNPDIPYLLLDDVVTTGATLRAAAKVLQASGACTIWVATLTRQPLDEKHKIDTI